MVDKEMPRWKLKVRNGEVCNTGRIIALKQECDDLVKIVVAIFDLEGFTNFFDSASVNRNIVVSAYMKGFLDWLNYQIDQLREHYVPRPRYHKFLGDGVLLIWEVGDSVLSHPLVRMAFMNACWNMVDGKESYESTFLPEFKQRIGRRWTCEYPSRLRVSISLGHAVRYGNRHESCEYISECINVASRLVKFRPSLRFIAHSDLVFGSEPRKYGYIQKKISIKGINDRVGVFVDKDEFDKLSDEDKQAFRNPKSAST